MARNNKRSNVLEKKGSFTGGSAEEVRIVQLKDSDAAAQCLTEAFVSDEVARYFVDTNDMAKYPEEVKYKLHSDILRYLTAAHILKGEVTTIGPNYDAVALW